MHVNDSQRRWTRHRARIALVVGIAVLASSGLAFGWGRIGHRVSARLTESLLTPKTKDAIARLLDPGESLADASLWADQHRSELPKTAPWHYVNVPIDEAKYDARFCQAGGCVVSKIGDFVAQLKDPATPVDQKRFALRFLIHCVQDMHQPVHVGDNRDRGGNDLQVQFFGKGSNLHRVWDSGLIEQVSNDETQTFDRLKLSFTPEFQDANRGGTVEDWANESLAAAKAAYNDPATGEILRSGAKLGDAYQEAQIPVAERRVLQASVRLARLLNEIFDPMPEPAKPD